jgi:Rrf2 family iron-sulfur cluster assembly transcriptional regulator
MLSKSCIYGLQAVLYLASQKQDGYVSIREISDSLGFSYAFLTKVLQELTRRGLLQSLRGPHGGVVLARPAEEITLAEIVEAIDGPRLFEACILGLPTCGSDQPCLLHERWAPLRGEIEALFGETTIREMVEEGRSFSSEKRTKDS